MRVDAAAQTVCDARERARPARGRRRDHDGRAGRAAERFGRGGIGGVARLRRTPRPSRRGIARRRSRRSGRRRPAPSRADQPDGHFAAQRERCGERLQRGLGERAVRLRVRQEQDRFHVIPPRSTATISRAISSAGMSFTIRVSRCCFGRLTEAKHSPVLGIGDGFARCSAGMIARMFSHADLRVVARLGQMAGGPAEHRRGRGADGHLVAAAFDPLEDFEASRPRARRSGRRPGTAP